MSKLTHGDGDLHYADGSHRTTAPTTSGMALANYQRRIEAHLAEHRRRGDSA